MPSVSSVVNNSVVNQNHIDILKMKLLKHISFCFLGIILIVLILATILEKVISTEFVVRNIYSSVLFVLLWCATALFSLLYILRCKLQRRLATCFIHLSFLLILVGAFTTWLHGEQGTVHLRKDTPVQTFLNKDGHQDEFPFRVGLKDFDIIYYTGTSAPMDFVSHIAIEDAGNTLTGRVAMNHIFSYQNYRFYQSGYDADGEGTILSVSHDPYGIAITYAGYALLLLSFILFFTDKQSLFRKLIKSDVLKRTICLLLLLLPGTLAIQAAVKPKVLPKEIASRFGNLYVLYNDRVCPLQTLAKDFTIKLYGKATYQGLTPEQVFTGWIFYYSSWKLQPMIKIKSSAAWQILGIEGRYASLADYMDKVNAYKLDAVKVRIQSGENVADKRGIGEADEKFNLISMLYSGKMLKIFPYRSADDKSLQWFAQGDRLPADMADEEWIFVRKSQSYVQEMVVKKDYEGVSALLSKIKEYQRKRAGDGLPSESAFKAEKIYNSLDYTKALAMGCIVIGLLAFVHYCWMLTSRRQVAVWLKRTLNALLAIAFLYLTAAVVLRGYVSNHLPLSNGFETMQFMAWATLLLTLFLQRKFSIALPFGFLLAGLVLMVSMMGEANPQITQLMPVLASPLLCIHVVVIMVAYSLLAFIMLNGLTAIILHYSRKDCAMEVERLQVISRIMLYPAVFLLATGIFIGAVWANVSWGRYWGWDPKEVWALITMLLYAVALHTSSLPWFRKPLFFHIFSIAAFLSVLITYFGVNFLLGGMHSYA